MKRPAPNPPVQSLYRGLLLLEAVALAERPLSLAELTPVLGIDRSSVFRLLSTLRQQGFLAQLPETKEYVLGSTVGRLARRFRLNDLLVPLARPQVAALASTTGETTHLAVLEGCEAVLIDHELTRQAVGVAAGSGFSVPLHCTSVGKALLADHDRASLTALLGNEPLARFTRRTIVAVAALADECRKTRARGYALDDEEHNDGVRCIACPIRDAADQVVASIGVSAPSTRLPRERFRSIAEKVNAAAEAIAAGLGRTIRSSVE